MKIDMKKALYCLLGLTFLQDSSADVTKLKLNDEVMNAFGSSKECTYQGIKFVKVVDNSDFIFDSKTYLIKDEYKGAIFCKKNGEIIIVKNNNLFNIQQKKEDRYTPLKSYKKSVPSKARKIKLNDIPFSAFRHDVLQREICKMQFENIIKSGLISGKKFNEQIYDTSIFAAGVDWQMPGISADISDLSLHNIPVMCAMKLGTDYCINQNVTQNNIKELASDTVSNTDVKTLEENWNNKRQKTFKYDQSMQAINGEYFLKYAFCQKHLLNRTDWNNIFRGHNNDSKAVYNIEHTERQLLLYHLFNMTGDKWHNDDGIERITGNACIDGRSLLIYTNGAPCFFEDHRMFDNCGICCWNIYKLMSEAMRSISVQVYFSLLEHVKVFPDNKTMKNIFGKQFTVNRQLSADELEGLSINSKVEKFNEYKNDENAWMHNNCKIGFTWLPRN